MPVPCNLTTHIRNCEYGSSDVSLHPSKTSERMKTEVQRDITGEAKVGEKRVTKATKNTRTHHKKVALRRKTANSFQEGNLLKQRSC
jgi:hypothetical protein